MAPGEQSLGAIILNIMPEQQINARLSRLESQMDSKVAWQANIASSTARIEQLLTSHIERSNERDDRVEKRLDELERDVKLWKRLGAVLGGLAIAAGSFVGWLTGR